MAFGHDVLEVGKIRSKLPGSLFKQSALLFGASLAFQVIVGVVEDVSEFLDGVEVDPVIDDVRVDHSVSVAFENGHDIHHLVPVIAKLPGIAYQFHLYLGFESPVGFAMAGEFVRGSDILGSAAAGGACADCIKYCNGGVESKS